MSAASAIERTDVFILKSFNEAVKTIKEKRSTGAKMNEADVLFMQRQINLHVDLLSYNGWTERDAKDVLRSTFELTQ